MTAPIRIGVTGSGFMGRTHVEAAKRASNAEIVAVAVGSRSGTLAADYGIDCETDAAALINRDDVDAVVITTPHHIFLKCGRPGNETTTTQAQAQQQYTHTTTNH